MDQQGFYWQVCPTETWAGLLPGTDAGQTSHTNVDRSTERYTAGADGSARSRWTDMHAHAMRCKNNRITSLPSCHKNTCVHACVLCHTWPVSFYTYCMCPGMCYMKHLCFEEEFVFVIVIFIYIKNNRKWNTEGDIMKFLFRYDLNKSLVAAFSYWITKDIGPNFFYFFF